MNRMMESDEDKLAGLGYKQELRREWGLIHNFGASFSIISVVTGITTLFLYGLTTGGPAVMTIGWIIASFFTMFVAFGMAEIVSAVPTSGGPYYWAAVLAPRSQSAFWSWMTGWFNFLGQVAVTTGISFGLAGLISTLAAIDGTYEPTPAKTIGIYAGILVSHGIVNTVGVRILGYLNYLSIFLHSAGVFSIAVACLAKAPTHQSAKFVFGKFYDGTGLDADGWSIRASPAYLSCIGVLMAQYTLTGFDSAAHLSEETKNAARSAPLGVVTSVGFSALFGFFYLVSLLFSIQDFDATVDSEVGQPVLQILVDVFGVTGAKVLFGLIIICVWHCGLFSITSNSRMMFAFARDGGIPRWFATVDGRFQSPIKAIWLAIVLAFCLALPSLGSSVAFAAATSIATIGLYISYGLPIALGMIYHRRFKEIRGPFNLGIASQPIALVACGWIICITVLFCLPQLNPVERETINYAPVATGIIFLGALLSWFAFARKTFKGPLAHLAEEGIDVAPAFGDEGKKDADGAAVKVKAL